MTNPRHAAEGMIPTPQQWVNQFLDSTEGEQLNMARRVIERSEVAYQCRLMDHDGRIKHMAQELRDRGTRIRRMLDPSEFEANLNAEAPPQCSLDI